MKDKKKDKVSVKKGPSRFKEIMQSERTKFICGMLLLLLASFFGVAFLSFVVTGKEDQAILEHLQSGVMISSDNGINNWMGTLGAYAAEYCVNRWIGLPAILFVILLFRIGYSLWQRRSVRPYLGTFVRTSLWALWFSLFFSTISILVDFFFDAGMQSQFIYLGGYHGYELAQLLSAHLGKGGLVLSLIASGLIMSVFVYASTIERSRTLFGFAPWLATKYSRLREKAAERKAQREAARLAAEEQAALEAQQEAEKAEQEALQRESELEKETAEQTESVPMPFVPAEERMVEEEPAEQKSLHELFDQTFEQKPTDPLPSETTYEPKPNDPLFTVTSGKTETVAEPTAADTSDLPQEDYDPTADLSHYQFPSFDLLKTYNANVPVDIEEQTANKEKIQRTLQDYGIEIQSISATVGPTITLFEIVLVSGTKINRVKNLSDEIAMSIAAKSGIRIIAPIPGKCAIGIEVPNNDPQTVSMRDCIASKTFQESKMELPVALGKTITNEVFTFDLAKAPHLLVAGATGQGKSVGLNAIITSLLYKKHPSQLKIVLVDPKMVEFSIYKPIERHYLAKLPDMENPIITDVTKTVDILKSLCAEMEDRYALVEDAGVRNIKEYNEKFIHRKLNPKKHITAPIGSREGTHHRYLPYIVAIIDEYGDLIMTAGKEVELPIARIAQKARAVGIHMIIATQRPSAKIVTGIIKANFPARIAFRVSQSIDSSIIIDQPGAQNLIGRGDLLYSSGNVPERVQCAFVDTPEVDRINQFIAEQQGYPTALILPEPKLAEGEGTGEEGDSGSVDLNHLDSLFDECAELVVATGQGSTSMIQRKFQIGYNRAGRIMDQLEAAGIVGPYSGSKARAVLVDSDSELQNIIMDLKNR